MYIFCQSHGTYWYIFYAVNGYFMHIYCVYFTCMHVLLNPALQKVRKLDKKLKPTITRCTFPYIIEMRIKLDTLIFLPLQFVYTIFGKPFLKLKLRLNNACDKASKNRPSWYKVHLNTKCSKICILHKMCILFLSLVKCAFKTIYVLMIEILF